MKLFLITAAIVALCMAGIAIKIWAKKGGQFSGTCASNNPHLNKEGEPCGFCGSMPGDACANVDKVMEKKAS